LFSFTHKNKQCTILGKRKKKRKAASKIIYLLISRSRLFSGLLGCFSRSFNSLAGILSRSTVDLSELVGIKLGVLKKLDLADVNVGNRIDTNAALLDLLGNNLRDELVHKLMKAADRSLTTHDLHHTLADQVHTTRLSVGGKRMTLVTNGILLLCGESNAEHTHDVTIKSLHINVSLDERLPLADKRPETIVGEVHAMEISQATTTIDLIYTELHLSVSEFLILLKISQVGLKHTALKSISSDLKTDSLVYASLANSAVDEVVGSNNIIPFLTKEGILYSLTATLLSRL